MTDWERVERLRSKGWDWSAIAEDEKVAFTAPAGVSDAGRALKALYFQRRSSRRANGKAERTSSRVAEEEASKRARSWRARAPLIGLMIAFAAGVWILFGLTVLSSLLVIVPLLYMGIALAFGLVVFGLSLVFGGRGVGGGWRRAVAISVVVALLVTGGGALAAVEAGIPNLSTNITPQPSNSDGTWYHAANPVWTENGRPVFLYVGSVACPYCSASSWAMRGALEAFGSLSGWTYLQSSSTDVYPNTPEVDLSAVSYNSSYLSLSIYEGTDDSSISVPPLPPLPNAYVQTYDSSGGIPFVVVGGQYFHLGSLVNPATLSPGGTALSPQQVENDLASGTGPVYSEINSAQLYLEAYFVKADQKAGITPPAAVTGDPAVMSIVAQITA
jgi:hypothetical protein